MKQLGTAYTDTRKTDGYPKELGSNCFFCPSPQEASEGCQI